MSEPDVPVIAAYKPCLVTLEEGRRYSWCVCGKSAKQPFCDGAHKGTPFKPLVFAAEVSGDALLCACKRTKTPPYCDGSHNNLPGAYEEDDPDSPENQKVRMVPSGPGPVTELDGGCYVFSTSKADMREKGSARYTNVITPARGAIYQSQFYLELEQGLSPAIGFEDRHVVIFVAEGAGKIQIGSRAFDIRSSAGVYIRPGEHCRIDAQDKMKLFISVCPLADDLEFSEHPTNNFDESFAERVVHVDPDKRAAMATRFFQVLVDKTMGSTQATQFIGHIPLSKAAPHRHLYEESLIILSGHGVMWTDTKKTPVEAGDVIFLPHKQIHSLQSTGEDGMDVVGVIYPGDNPSINY